MSGYRIQRFYVDTSHPKHGATIRSGLSRADAEAHCQDPKTRKVDAQGRRVWWDAFTDGHGDLDRERSR